MTPTRRTVREPAVSRRALRVQCLDLNGKPYVLVPKADFERLRQLARRNREDAAPFGKGSVGPDLRTRRHAAGLTLLQVARRAGIAVENLSRIETGRRDPSVRTVRSVLWALEGEA